MHVKVPVKHQLLVINAATVVDSTFLCWCGRPPTRPAFIRRPVQRKYTVIVEAEWKGGRVRHLDSKIQCRAHTGHGAKTTGSAAYGPGRCRRRQSLPHWKSPSQCSSQGRRQGSIRRGLHREGPRRVRADEDRLVSAAGWGTATVPFKRGPPCETQSYAVFSAALSGSTGAERT